MNFIFVSPHFPSNFEPFILKLREQGVNVFGIGDEPYSLLSPTLKDSLNEYYYVRDMANYDEMYKAVAYLSFKHGKMDRLESHNEHWLAQDARLRTDFNIFGLKLSDIEIIKFKSKMKDVFMEANLPVAKGRVFVDDADARSLAKQLGYPVLVKPDSGVGASDTYRLNDEEQLNHFLRHRRFIDYIMEEFLNGTIVTFDGLCDQNNQLVYTSHMVYDKTTLEYQSMNQETIFRVHPKIPKKLRTLGNHMVKQFNLRERFFHAEFIYYNKQYYAMEINCRPPGGWCLDAMNYANDIDLFWEYANLVTKNQFLSKPTNKYSVFYVSRNEPFVYRHSIQEVYQRFGVSIRLAKEVPYAFRDIMGSFAFLVKTPTLSEGKKIVKFIVQKK